MNSLPKTRLVLLLVLGMLLTLAACSDDDDCPTCPPCPDCPQWTSYDDFDDDAIDTTLWATGISYGGQVLETSGQLQVWGHTGGWTGSGTARTHEARNGWRFSLEGAYFEEGPGCQGWWIRLYDSALTASFEVLNHRTAGCGNNMSSPTGYYEFVLDGDSVAVYRNGTLSHRVDALGIDKYVLYFHANNVYGSGHHARIFMDNVMGLE